MVGRRCAANTNTAAQHDGHLEATATHILDFADLVDHLAHCIEDEVDEHEVHDGARAGHCRASTHTNKAAFADWRVAQAFGAIFLIKTERGREVATTLANTLAKNKDGRVFCH